MGVPTRHHRLFTAATTGLFLALLCVLVDLREPHVLAQTSAGGTLVTRCPDANPYDTAPDDVAIQQCLGQYDRVLLAPPEGDGYIGYVVSDTIDLTRNGVLLTSASSPRLARLVAAPSLAVPMLRTRANNFEISFISFDGNQAAREVRDKACNTTRNYRNVELTGVGFRVRYVESFNAVCGSAMTVGGSSRFEISNSRFYNNGRQPEDAKGLTGLWADGLNVFNCTGATIRDNVFWDNTDVDLGVAGGPGCSVYRNRIEHYNHYAFAGLVAGDPSRRGGEFSDNTIVSGPDMLGFGLMVGCHAWPECVGAYSSGLYVHDNDVVGAVVNLVVDGVDSSRIENNTIGRSQGSRILNCVPRADYLVAHVIDVRLQPGFQVLPIDFGRNCS